MGAASGSVRGSGGDAARQRIVVTIRKRNADLARLREDHARKVGEEAEAKKRAASANAKRTWMRTELRRITARLHKQDAEVQLPRDAITRQTANAEEARGATERAAADAASAVVAGGRMCHAADVAQVCWWQLPNRWSNRSAKRGKETATTTSTRRCRRRRRRRR